MKEKIEKLILAGGEDLLVANELIKKYDLLVIPESFSDVSIFSSRRIDKTIQYWDTKSGSIYILNDDKTWYKVQSVSTTTSSTTTKI